MIGRRHCLTGIAVAAIVRAPAAAQQPAMPVIGFLGSAAPEPWARRLSAFRQGLQEAGYVEGRNVAIEYRWAETKVDRLPTLAADLVRDRVTVIVVIGGRASSAGAPPGTSTGY